MIWNVKTRRIARKWILATAAVACMMRGRCAWAAEPASAPATGPSVEHLKATIIAIEGNVRLRVPGGTWSKCVVGQMLDGGVEIRTAPDSSVQCSVAPDQTITIPSMSKVTLIDFVKTGGKINADVGLKHGTIKLNINAAGVEHESTIRSPNSTLAVSGTTVSLTDQRPFPPVAVSLTGRARFATAKAKTAFGSKGGGKLKVTTDQPISAQQLLSESITDPSIALARSAEDRLLLANVLALGGVVNFGNDRQIPVVTNLPAPATDAGIKPFVVGSLDFVIYWHTNANLDLTIANQSSEVMFPHTGANTTKSGGEIPFDDQGGATGGIELGYWKNHTFPIGEYVAAVTLVSGPATPFTLDVFQKNMPEQTFNLNATATSDGIVSVPIGVNVPPPPPIATGRIRTVHADSSQQSEMTQRQSGLPGKANEVLRRR